MDSRVSRRTFVATAGSALASVVLGDGCVAAQGREPRFTARPRSGVTTSLDSGPLGLAGSGRDALFRMPSKPAAGAGGKIPLLVFLHGATQSGAMMMNRVGPAADQSGVAVLAPDSRGRTWDAITGGFGEDVAFLDRALDTVFARMNVDPARLAIGGFSDGASYALTVGLANGDLFSHVVACSPGFVLPVQRNGRPRFFVSHGTADQILPIDECSRVIVPRLNALEYDVTYREFEGRHEVPPDIASLALRWLMAV